MRNVLAVDQGSHNLGWCVMHQDTVVDVGTIRAPRKSDFESRRDVIRSQFSSVILEYHTVAGPGKDIDTIVVEDTYSAGFHASVMLRTIRAMVEEVALSHQIYARAAIRPNVWHKIMKAEALKHKLLNGNTKAMSINTARMIVGPSIDSIDCADAYWIARAARESLDAGDIHVTQLGGLL